MNHHVRQVVFLVLVVVICMPSDAQVFVRTIADTPPVTGATDVISPATIETKAQAHNFIMTPADDVAKLINELKANNAKALTDPEKEKLTAALVREKLRGLATASDDDFKKKCKEVEPALVNNFMPTLWESERTACFWQQQGTDALREARLSGGTNRGTAAVELLSDIFWGLRVRVQSGVSASGGDENESAEARAERNLQALLASGGNLSFSGTYPWYLHRSGAGKVESLITSYGRLGATVPILGQDDEENSVAEDDINASFELGLVDAQTRIGSFRNNVNVVAFGRAGVVQGTKHFHHDIGNEDEALLWYGEVGAGFRLSNLLWVLGSWTGYSADSLPGGQFTVTVGVGK